MATVQGVLTALVVVSGMIAVAFVTVVWSDSQQFPTQQRAVAGDSTSTSIANETSLTHVNETTPGQQVGTPSPETGFVSILLGSGDSVSFSYSPDQVTVVMGVNNTVTWVNNDNAPHTVTANDGSFGSGNIGSGGSYTYTFTEPGTYAYYCAYHSWMVGTVVVKAA
ncbi:MAG TPA: cupredoxin domain-containing protein [Nitrososphaerales archaeon]|nr:cupredoxin domain-containing protein [Nitrososphaerales archaeon]